jgi:biotin carboxyl carrier protein
VTVEIELNGNRRRVEARRDGERWIVAVDGRQVTASAAESGERWSLLIGPPEGGPHVGSGFGRTARSYDVSFEQRGGGDWVVYVNGTAIPVSMVDPRAGLRRRPQDGGASAARASIVAPMPGRIVKVLVKPGDVVAARQGVVIVEAMKMENELRAPRPGTVADVRVTEGISVEANSVLIVLE